MNFSWVHALHDGDSILLPLISTLRWTPFYWGDNRYGMPVPFAASWIHDPAWNLLFQTQFFSLSIVALVVIGSAFFFHANRTPLRVRMGTACLSLVFAIAVFRPTQSTARIYFLADPYVISLAPLLGAVALVFRVDRSRPMLRLLIAVPLVFVALWINYTHIAVAVPLAVFIPDGNRKWRDTIAVRLAFVSLAAACFAAVRAWASRYPRFGEPGWAPSQWLTTASELFSNIGHTVVYPWILFLLACCAILAGVHLSRTEKLRGSDGLIFCGVAVMVAAAVTLSDWPMQNAYAPRYWTTPLTLVVLAVTIVAARGLYDLLEQLVSSPKIAVTIAALLLTAVSIRLFGVPQPGKTRQLLLATTGQTGVHAIKLGCTHMIGEYHAAWMSTFYARAVGRELWAAVPRGEMTRDVWDRMPPPQRKFCATVNQAATLYSLTAFKLGLPVWSGYSGGLVRYELR